MLVLDSNGDEYSDFRLQLGFHDLHWGYLKDQSFRERGWLSLAPDLHDGALLFLADHADDARLPDRDDGSRSLPWCSRDDDECVVAGAAEIPSIHLQRPNS